MMQAHHDVRIDRPINEVFDYLADGAHNPDWQPLVVRTERVGESLGVGTLFTQRVRHPLGYTVPADYRITSYEAPRRLTLTVTSGGPIRPTLTYSLTADGEATLVRCTIEHRPHGVARIAAPVLALLHPLYAWEASWIERAREQLEPTTASAI
jgi:uncharacterized protein YndB with AHSA1/START domain